MNEYIERIATAICEADCGTVSENELDRCRGLARAAVNAAREPTDAMKVAGGLKCEAMMFEGDPDFTGVIFNDMGVVFRTMLDTATQEVRS